MHMKCTSTMLGLLMLYSNRSVRCMIGTWARDFQFYRFAALASTKMRRDLCSAIIKAPMIFFMTENLGPLTGVFTKDLGVVNTERKYFAFTQRRELSVPIRVLTVLLSA
jgi:hypothetical protein